MSKRANERLSPSHLVDSMQKIEIQYRVFQQFLQQLNKSTLGQRNAIIQKHLSINGLLGHIWHKYPYI